MSNYLLLNDPKSVLRGTLRVMIGSGALGVDKPDEHRGIASICGSASTWGVPLSLIRSVNVGLGEDPHPADTFRRMADSTTGNPGLCSETLHLWRVTSGSFTLSAQTLKPAASPSGCYLPVRHAASGGESRAIEAVIKTGAAYQVTVSGNVVAGGANNGKSVAVKLNNKKLLLYVNGVVVAEKAEAVAEGVTYTVVLALTRGPLGKLTKAVVYLNGTEELSHELTAEESGGILPGTKVPFLEDGLLFQDTASVCTSFRVRAL